MIFFKIKRRIKFIALFFRIGPHFPEPVIQNILILWKCY